MSDKKKKKVIIQHIMTLTSSLSEKAKNYKRKKRIYSTIYLHSFWIYFIHKLFITFSIKACWLLFDQLHYYLMLFKYSNIFNDFYYPNY